MSRYVIAKKEAHENGNSFALFNPWPPEGTAGGYRWVSRANDATHLETEAEADRAQIRAGGGYVIEAWIVEKINHA